MKIETMFEEFADEYLRFEKIENPRHPRPDICAFLLLHDLVPGTRDMVSSAEHDQIWLDVDLEELDAVATVADVLTLRRCGVRIEDGMLTMFA